MTFGKRNLLGEKYKRSVHFSGFVGEYGENVLPGKKILVRNCVLRYGILWKMQDG